MCAAFTPLPQFAQYGSDPPHAHDVEAISGPLTNSAYRREYLENGAQYLQSDRRGEPKSGTPELKIRSRHHINNIYHHLINRRKLCSHI